MKNSFIFYASFDEALRELPDKSRLKMYDAIADYALRGIIRTDFKGIEKAVYSLIIPQLQANNNRYENGCKGGRPKKTEQKPMVLENENQNETNGGIAKKTKTKPNENENENVNVNDNTPLFIPPQGEKKQSAADEFFSLYPRYAKDRAKMRADVDYKRLIEEFGKSKYLRSLYTVKQINELYPLIIAGDYRDKETPNPFADIEAKAARERWYAERKAAAERKAESVLERFLQDEEFKRIHKRLGVLPCEIGKAEYQAENGDAKAQKQLVKLTQEKARLTLQYRGIIEKNGMTEEDLLPKWHCWKCKDEGYLTDGRMCDCYPQEVVNG
jgi:hypothetical protein